MHLPEGRSHFIERRRNLHANQQLIQTPKVVTHAPYMSILFDVWFLPRVFVNAKGRNKCIRIALRVFVRLTWVFQVEWRI